MTRGDRGGGGTCTLYPLMLFLMGGDLALKILVVVIFVVVLWVYFGRGLKVE